MNLFNLKEINSKIKFNRRALTALAISSVCRQKLVLYVHVNSKL